MTQQHERICHFSDFQRVLRACWNGKWCSWTGKICYLFFVPWHLFENDVMLSSKLTILSNWFGLHDAEIHYPGYILIWQKMKMSKGGLGDSWLHQQWRQRSFVCGPCGHIFISWIPGHHSQSEVRNMPWHFCVDHACELPLGRLKSVYHGGSIWLVLGYSLFLNVHTGFFSCWYN